MRRIYPFLPQSFCPAEIHHSGKLCFILHVRFTFFFKNYILHSIHRTFHHLSSLMVFSPRRHVGFKKLIYVSADERCRLWGRQ